MDYVNTAEASRRLGAHPNTLRRWADEGRIQTIRTEGGQRRNAVDDYLGESRPIRTVRYCRVSSVKRKPDLDRQIAFMRERYPDAEIVSDIGSGLNYKRRGLNAILERACGGERIEVVVAYRDRPARFGAELIQSLIERGGGRVVVLNQIALSPQDEPAADLLAILTALGARVDGLRRYRKKIAEDSSLSERESASDA